MREYKYYEERRNVFLKKQRWLGNCIAGCNFAGTRLLSNNEGNKIIKELLMSDQPITISRFGKTEMDPVMYREIKKNNNELKQRLDQEIGNCSGFFPCTSEMVDRYFDLYIQVISDIDFMGIWFFVENEEYMIEKYMNHPYCGLPKCLEPFYFRNPWSLALKGKKVLVIHPFSETIQKQYFTNRRNIFKNQDILPEFDLKTIKAVQTLADERDSRFQNWFEALDWMKQKIEETDFDIALLGCGAYGIPLQHHIKSLGKKSVYMGGGLQIMFGIKGLRWDNIPSVRKFYNEYWVRPGKIEGISSAHKVEMGGPYW